MYEGHQVGGRHTWSHMIVRTNLGLWVTFKNRGIIGQTKGDTKVSGDDGEPEGVM